MVNLENNLTVDDLIVEYMIYKVNNGYEPQFLSSELISFLYFFENKMPVQDSLYENEKLFQRFFERKAVVLLPTGHQIDTKLGKLEYKAAPCKKVAFML